MSLIWTGSVNAGPGNRDDKYDRAEEPSSCPKCHEDLEHCRCCPVCGQIHDTPCVPDDAA